MKILLSTLLVLCSVISQGQTWEDTVAKIEKAMVRYKPNNPGGQLAISRHGKLIFSKAWGMADLEHNAPLQTISPTEAGSVSKQITAAAILLLEQEGKLSLNDDIRKYLPELPDYGHVITIRHMMQHTSGLKDWGAIASVAGWPRSTKTYSNDDAILIMSQQKTLNNKPGAEFIYSNSNYNAMAVIVQRVSGLSLAEYTRLKIFIPAGMKHTEWRDNFKKVVPNRAIAYAKSGGAYITNMPNEYVYGNGGLLTTAEDLVKWTNYYQAGQFGSPSLLHKQITSNPFNNGGRHEYAAGLFISTYRGWNLYAHDGATASYRANLDNFPDLGLSIAWLSNTSEFDRDSNIPEAIREIFIPDQAGKGIIEELMSYEVAPERYNEYLGWYRNLRSGSGIKIWMNNGKLTGSQVGALKPLADDLFAVGTAGSKVKFSRGKNAGFIFMNTSLDSVQFVKVDSAKMNPELMKEYVGDYYSEDANTKYTIKIKDGKLVLSQPPTFEIPLTATYVDGFDTPVGPMLFSRGKDKKINGFGVSVSRARNVPFTKISK